MSLDLHGYTVAEAVELFVAHYNQHVGRGDLSRIRVIHGYGSGGTGGKIRTSLRRFLSAFPDAVAFEMDEVNPGVTIVLPVVRLPEGAGILTGEILEFCRAGKTESKILGKLRSYGDLQVKKTLRSLVKKGLLKTVRKGRHTLYTAS